jgi:hypothetical protein
MCPEFVRAKEDIKFNNCGLRQVPLDIAQGEKGPVSFNKFKSPDVNCD